MAAHSSGGTKNRRKAKDESRAAALKAAGECRVTQRCPVCYRIVACESWKSRYAHVCR